MNKELSIESKKFNDKEFLKLVNRIENENKNEEIILFTTKLFLIEINAKDFGDAKYYIDKNIPIIFGGYKLFILEKNFGIFTQTPSLDFIKINDDKIYITTIDKNTSIDYKKIQDNKIWVNKNYGVYRITESVNTEQENFDQEILQTIQTEIKDLIKKITKTRIEEGNSANYKNLIQSFREITNTYHDIKKDLNVEKDIKNNTLEKTIEKLMNGWHNSNEGQKEVLKKLISSVLLELKIIDINPTINPETCEHSSDGWVNSKYEKICMFCGKILGSIYNEDIKEDIKSVTKTQIGLSAVSNDAQIKIASNLEDKKEKQNDSKPYENNDIYNAIKNHIFYKDLQGLVSKNTSEEDKNNFMTKHEFKISFGKQKAIKKIGEDEYAEELMDGFRISYKDKEY